MIALAVVGYVLGLFFLAAALLFVVDRVRSCWNRVPSEELARRRVEYIERLRHPRWDELESHFKSLPAQELLALYDSELVLREDITFLCPTENDPENEECVANFTPADLRSVVDASWVVGDQRLPFAEDAMGNYYTVDFGTAAHVRFHMHDGGDSWEVAATLQSFVTNMTNRERSSAKR